MPGQISRACFSYSSLQVQLSSRQKETSHPILDPLGKEQSGSSKFIKNFFLNLFIMAVLGPPCCMGFSLVAASWGYCLVAMLRLLIAVASLVLEHRL